MTCFHFVKVTALSFFANPASIMSSMSSAILCEAALVHNMFWHTHRKTHGSMQLSDGTATVDVVEAKATVCHSGCPHSMASQRKKLFENKS